MPLIWTRSGRFWTMDIVRQLTYGVRLSRTMVPSRKTDAHNFIQLFRKYTQVKNDPIEFGRLTDLDNLPVIKALTMKFTSNSIRLKYAEYRFQQKAVDPDVNEFDILDGLMKW